MLLLLLGLLIFFMSHSLASLLPGLRQQLLNTLTNKGYRVAFAVVSLISFTLIVVGFAYARLNSPVLWVPPPELKWLSRVLMLVALVFLCNSFGRSHLKKLVKHPQLTAVKAWSTAHLLANGRLVDVFLFGTFLLWAVMTRVQLKRRSTTLASFAPIEGDAYLLHDLISTGVAFCLYSFFLLGGHLYIFGVNPLL